MPEDVNLETSKRTLANMVHFPTNQFEAFAEAQTFMNKNLTVGHRALFLLQQELLYAQNVRSRHVVNPFAIWGLIPFSGGIIPTAFDPVEIPGANIVEKMPEARKISAQLGYNLGQLEANFNQPQSPIDLVRAPIKSIIANLLGKTVDSSDPASKRDKTIEEYLRVNEREEPTAAEVAPRVAFFSRNDAYADEAKKQDLVKEAQFPFYFKSLNYDSSNDKDTTKKGSSRLYLFFQGIINSLSESFAPNWNQEEIFGRPHPMWIYSNVNRSINIDFLIIANKFGDLETIRQRADWLSKHTYPVLAFSGKGQASHFKSGPMVSLTIGNLFTNLNGFISSLEFDWNTLKRWEVEKNIVFPQGLKVALRLNILEESLIHNTDDDTVNIYEPFDNSAFSIANTTSNKFIGRKLVRPITPLNNKLLNINTINNVSGLKTSEKIINQRFAMMGIN